MTRNTAAVVGATGLTGRYLMNVLAEDAYYDRVLILTRRPIPPPEIVTKVENIFIDFDRIADLDLSGVTHLFCCLGTTIRNAGSKEAFRKVDHEYVCGFAAAGRAHGARHFSVVSSVGASASTGNFYLRVKGEMEASVSAMGFPELHIFRPGVLLGHREEQRPGEAFAAAFARGFEFLFAGPLRKYRPMPAALLASAMSAGGERGGAGRHIHHYDEIRSMAGI